MYRNEERLRFHKIRQEVQAKNLELFQNDLQGNFAIKDDLRILEEKMDSVIDRLEIKIDNLKSDIANKMIPIIGVEFLSLLMIILGFCLHFH